MISSVGSFEQLSTQEQTKKKSKCYRTLGASYECLAQLLYVEFNLYRPVFLFSVVNFDAKINFDDNAEFRQKEIFAMDDGAETDPRELEASKHNLNYIGMDGNIACLGIQILVLLYTDV